MAPTRNNSSIQKNPYDEEVESEEEEGLDEDFPTVNGGNTINSDSDSNDEEEEIEPNQEAQAAKKKKQRKKVMVQAKVKRWQVAVIEVSWTAPTATITTKQNKPKKIQLRLSKEG